MDESITDTVNHMLEKWNRKLKTWHLSSRSGKNSSVILIDPCCRFPHGHHPVVNLLISKYCRDNGIPIRILVDRKCDSQICARLNAEPVLDYNFSANIPGDETSLMAMLEHFNELMFQNLVSTIKAPADGDVIVIHTANPWTLLGVYRWIKNFQHKSVKLRIQFMFPPEHRIPEGARNVILDF